MDIFRIFDALNDVSQMRPAIDAVRETGTAVAEVAVCYTGDLLDPAEQLYTLDYYLRLAEQIVDSGAHILAIKDMAGLLRPAAAAKLVAAFRERFDLPVHVHTHDTAGGQLATLLAASEAGADAVDVAAAPMSGTTSQPSLSALVAALAHTERDTGSRLQAIADLEPYWEGVRQLYRPFESGLRAPDRPRVPPRDPGRPAVEPAAAGDRAGPRGPLRAHRGHVRGGQPDPRPHPQGDPVLQGRRRSRAAARGGRAPTRRLRAEPAELRHPRLGRRVHGRRARRPAGRVAGAVPHEGARRTHVSIGVDADLRGRRSVLSTVSSAERRRTLNRLLFPGPTAEFERNRAAFGDLSALDTPDYLYGLVPGEEHVAEIDPGVQLYVGLEAIGEADEKGIRTVMTTLNGQLRPVFVRDRSIAVDVPRWRRPTRRSPARWPRRSPAW